MYIFALPIIPAGVLGGLIVIIGATGDHLTSKSGNFNMREKKVIINIFGIFTYFKIQHNLPSFIQK